MGICCCDPRWVKFTGLVLGCLGEFVTGSVFVFNLYLGAIKRTFNYTQQEVELQSSLLYLGQGFGIIPGMFFDRFGPAWTSAVGLVLAVSSYVFLWTTSGAVLFYSIRSWLMGIYFFVAGKGVGTAFTYMVSMNTNLVNFTQQQRGKVMGTLNCFFSGSPFVYSLVYYHVFNGNDPDNLESFPRLMMLVAISFAVVNSLCILFLRRLPESKERANQSISYEDINGIPNDLSKVLEKDVSMSTTCLAGNCNFHALLWVFTLTSSVGVFVTNNLTEIATSVRLDRHNPTLVLLIPVTTMVVSILIGVLSDKYIGTFPRSSVVLIGIGSFIISQMLFLLLADVFSLLIIATILVGIGNAIMWSLGPVLTADILYIGNLGRNWGLITLVNAIFCFALQEVFGVMYENAITTPNELFCFGLHCLRGAFGIGLTSTLLSFLPALVLFIRTKSSFPKPKPEVNGTIAILE
ncbi:hypothetical protein KP79_PYT24880 [Mizuhopecten yessoensis]|uniref:Nodulin-like domain-containing protein n=2 Tax=Mizuhopecten yessoensis TaxID=6573 RepID=A0A210Q4M0_MIZYE|nr:hypothetical protein KP79_PYT24880 [Mizuhopecten yessoensis]